MNQLFVSSCIPSDHEKNKREEKLTLTFGEMAALCSGTLSSISERYKLSLTSVFPSRSSTISKRPFSTARCKQFFMSLVQACTSVPDSRNMRAVSTLPVATAIRKGVLLSSLLKSICAPKSRRYLTTSTRFPEAALKKDQNKRLTQWIFLEENEIWLDVLLLPLWRDMPGNLQN